MLGVRNQLTICIQMKNKNPKFYIAPISRSTFNFDYVELIIDGVEISKFDDVIDFQPYVKLYKKQNRIHAWGVTEFKSNIWARINQGDIILFYKNYKVFSYSKVLFTVKSERISKLLFKTKNFSCLIFLSPPSIIEIKIKKISKLSGYSENFVPHSFIPLNSQFHDFLSTCNFELNKITS